MVICKYFQNGNCRFGTKCINEHFDIKQIIKTEVEAALKGSQWPLSCFGPFKEKSCIPNFIEDQSFEETRYLCYEAKKQNCFPQFAQEFNQQVMDAQNKMKTLLTLNRDVIAIVINLYNSTDTGKNNSQSGNTFSPGLNTNPASTSFFGSNSTQTNPLNNSLFRSSTTSNNTNAFGGQSVTSTGSNSILGQNSFGTGFGSNSQGSLFGQQTNSFKQTGSNLFSMDRQQQQASIFTGNTQNQALAFNNTTGFNTTTQTNVFGQSQQQPQQPSQSINTSNLFSQQNQQLSGFATLSQVQTKPQQAFLMQQSEPAAGLFGQQQHIQQQQQPQQQQQQQQHNFFNQQSNQPQNMSNMQHLNLFSSAQQPQNLAPPFGSTQQQLEFQQQNISAPSMFTQQGPQQQQQQMGTFLGQLPQQGNSFQQTGNVIESTFNPNVGDIIDDIPISENLYSKIEFLKPEEIEAFKAEKFEIGKIPVDPPARELIQFK